MKEQIETAYPAETLYLWTVTKPAKRLLGIDANRYQAKNKMKFIGKILCKIGIHKWENWDESWEIIPMSIVYCKRCRIEIFEKDIEQ